MSFANRTLTTDVIGAARALNVRYILRGTLRSDGRRIRVGVELVDGVTGYQIWATVFERANRQSLAVEDEIVAKVGALVDLELQSWERRRAMTEVSRPIRCV